MDITVPQGEASNRQLLIAVLNTLTRMERNMSEIDTAVTDLQTAVQGVADRIGTQIPALQKSVADAQQALTDFQAVDTTEDVAQQQAIADLTAQLAAALGGVKTAAAAVEAQAAALNQMAVPPANPAGGSAV